MFYEASKAFIKLFEVPQRSVKKIFHLIFFLRQELGREELIQLTRDISNTRYLEHFNILNKCHGALANN